MLVKKRLVNSEGNKKKPPFFRGNNCEVKGDKTFPFQKISSPPFFFPLFCEKKRGGINYGEKGIFFSILFPHLIPPLEQSMKPLISVNCEGLSSWHQLRFFFMGQRIFPFFCLSTPAEMRGSFKQKGEAYDFEASLTEEKKNLNTAFQQGLSFSPFFLFLKGGKRRHFRGRKALFLFQASENFLMSRKVNFKQKKRGLGKWGTLQ